MLNTQQSWIKTNKSEPVWISNIKGERKGAYLIVVACHIGISSSLKSKFLESETILNNLKIKKTIEKTWRAIVISSSEKF